MRDALSLPVVCHTHIDALYNSGLCEPHSDSQSSSAIVYLSEVTAFEVMRYVLATKCYTREHVEFFRKDFVLLPSCSPFYQKLLNSVEPDYSLPN